MKNRYIVVSFYTPDYKDYAATLRASLQKFRIPHDLKAIPDMPSFSTIVRQKPHFILEMANKHRKDYDAVVWIDSDAIVQKNPKLFEKIKADLAVHYRDGVELLSGTMFWRTHTRARHALDVWAETAKNPMNHGPRICNLDCPEQQILQQMLVQPDATALNTLTMYQLPTEYCKIHGLIELNDLARRVVPVIEHFQASRQTRRLKPA